jgi:GTP 3',8-cyclase
MGNNICFPSPAACGDRTMAMGRYDRVGNDTHRSRVWKENMPGTALIDGQGRRLDYLRLSVTDRCNLRCRYCMPAEGIERLPHHDILSWEEMHRLCALLTGCGIRKIRVTGGEPLVRKGVVDFLAGLRELPNRPEIVLTTNGVLLLENLAQLQAAGVRRINLSLDSLQPEVYADLARRNHLDDVLKSMHAVLDAGLQLKINVVVVAGCNDRELLDFAALTRDLDLELRFIEAMPFAGEDARPWTPFGGDEILARLNQELELTAAGTSSSGNAVLYSAAGHRGRIGVINGFQRNFCGTCNRLRVDATGGLRTCLYGPTMVDLRALLRDGTRDEEIVSTVRQAVTVREIDGHDAAAIKNKPSQDSMSSIGG